MFTYKVMIISSQCEVIILGSFQLKLYCIEQFLSSLDEFKCLPHENITLFLQLGNNEEKWV